MNVRCVHGVLPAMAMVLLLSVVSCARVSPTNYYVLGLSNKPVGNTYQNQFPCTLAIVPFQSEPMYLRKKIIWRSGTSRLGYYSHEKWAALPSELFSYRLYQNTHDSNLFRRVLIGNAIDAADLVLTGRIVAFEEVDTPQGWFGRVEVKVELSEKDGTLLWSSVVGHTEPASERHVGAAVKAIASAVEQTVTAILSSVEQSLRERRAK